MRPITSRFSAGARARAFERPDRDREPSVESAPRRRTASPTRNYFPKSSLDMMGGGNLAARWHFGEGAVGARGNADFAKNGERLGIDVYGERTLETRYVLSARTGVWQWDDKLRPDRDAASFQYVARRRLQALAALARVRGLRARHESHRRAALPRHALAVPGGEQVTHERHVEPRASARSPTWCSSSALVLAACTAFAQDPRRAPPPHRPSRRGSPTRGADAAHRAAAATLGTTRAGLGHRRRPLVGPRAAPEQRPDAAEVAPARRVRAGSRARARRSIPPQKLTLRFNHKFHVEQQKLQCKTCHAGATTSESVADRLTPKGTTCDACHGTTTTI